MIRTNLEFKARVVNFARAAELAAQIATSPREIVIQVDTYFVCLHGRLKLREFGGPAQETAAPAELIWYQRADEVSFRTSAYERVPIADPRALKSALAGAYGTARIVSKERWLYLHDAVRIHLDRVQRLGDFLEFEAVLSEHFLQAAAREKLAGLRDHFRSVLGEALAGSYSDQEFVRADE